MVKATINKARTVNAVVTENGSLKSGKTLEQKTYTNDEYTHVQSSTSTSWTVNHNLNRKPSSVSVLSPGGIEVEAEITHVNDNQLIVGFSVPYSGTVRIS